MKLTKLAANACMDELLCKADVRRRQVLDAAATCFRQYGFHGTSIQRISEEAGMSPGHIYHYFRNKEAIVGGIIERDLQETLAHKRTTVSAMKPDSDGIAQACMAGVEEALAQRTNRDSASLYFEILAEAMRNESVAQLLREANKTIRTSMHEHLEQFPALRALKPQELEARIAVIMALFDGLMLQASILGPNLDRAALSPVIQHMLSLALGEPKPA